VLDISFVVAAAEVVVATVAVLLVLWQQSWQ